MPFTLRGPKGGLLIRVATAARIAKTLPALVKKFKRVTVTSAPTPPMPYAGLRENVVKWARWGVAHEPQIHYTEAADRDDWLTAQPRNKLPLTTDCSGFVTLCYWLAAALDPNGLGYFKLGYTGTLLDHAAKHGQILTDVSKARPGDPIVMGPGTGAHVVVVVEAGADPLVVSHGQEGGPRLQHLSVDTRTPKRVCVTLP